MSESRQHRALLKHPLVASFLWMKWQRIRSFYYFTLATYATFVLLLTLLVLLEYGGCGLAGSGAAEAEAETATEAAVEVGEASKMLCLRADTLILRLLLGVVVLGLGVVEVVQIGVSFKRYVSSPENLMQVRILIWYIFFTFPGGHPGHQHSPGVPGGGGRRVGGAPSSGRPGADPLLD